MPTYDATNYDPAAPVATVTLRVSCSSDRVNDVVLLIDTGADITLLPRSAVSQLGDAVKSVEKVEVAGFDGQSSLADAVYLDVIFLNRAYRGRYLICDDRHGILGRDLLNHVRLVFDGPRLQWAQ